MAVDDDIMVVVDELVVGGGDIDAKYTAFVPEPPTQYMVPL